MFGITFIKNNNWINFLLLGNKKSRNSTTTASSGFNNSFKRKIDFPKSRIQTKSNSSLKKIKEDLNKASFSSKTPAANNTRASSKFSSKGLAKSTKKSKSRRDPYPGVSGQPKRIQRAKSVKSAKTPNTETQTSTTLDENNLPLKKDSTPDSQSKLIQTSLLNKEIDTLICRTLRSDKSDLEAISQENLSRGISHERACQAGGGPKSAGFLGNIEEGVEGYSESAPQSQNHQQEFVTHLLDERKEFIQRIEDQNKLIESLKEEIRRIKTLSQYYPDNRDLIIEEGEGGYEDGGGYGGDGGGYRGSSSMERKVVISTNSLENDDDSYREGLMGLRGSVDQRKSDRNNLLRQSNFIVTPGGTPTNNSFGGGGIGFGSSRSSNIAPSSTGTGGMGGVGSSFGAKRADQSLRASNLSAPVQPQMWSSNKHVKVPNAVNVSEASNLSKAFLTHLEKLQNEETQKFAEFTFLRMQQMFSDLKTQVENLRNKNFSLVSLVSEYREENERRKLFVNDSMTAGDSVRLSHTNHTDSVKHHRSLMAPFNEGEARTQLKVNLKNIFNNTENEINIPGNLAKFEAKRTSVPLGGHSPVPGDVVGELHGGLGGLGVEVGRGAFNLDLAKAQMRRSDRRVPADYVHGGVAYQRMGVARQSLFGAGRDVDHRGALCGSGDVLDPGARVEKNQQNFSCDFADRRMDSPHFGNIVPASPAQHEESSVGLHEDSQGGDQLYGVTNPEFRRLKPSAGLFEPVSRLTAPQHHKNVN